MPPRPSPVHLAAALAGTMLVAGVSAGLFDLGALDTNPFQPSPAEGEGASGDVIEPTAQDDGLAPASSQSGDGGAADGDDQAHDAERAHEHHHDHGAGVDMREAGGSLIQPVKPRHEHFRSGEAGKVPTRAQAAELPVQLRSFTVNGDDGLEEMVERGYVDGAGTLDDPYVLDGFRVREDLTIKDTSKAIIIRNSFIEGQLTLNYNGPNVYVHHNHIFDLRVNENVRRIADTTAGLFEHNDVEFIGQLRHFGGEFAHNTVGPRPDGVVQTFLSDTGPKPLPEDLVWNFDGYHLGHVHNNTVDGRVDVKLHGHYHGSCSACQAHDHADPEDFPPNNDRGGGEEPGSSHSFRWHTLDFEHNTITVGTQDVALRFYDDAHAGDDQTANSEPNAYLEDLHQHHTFIRIAGNDVRGGSLFLDIVNPGDTRHKTQPQEALVHLVGNDVALEQPRYKTPLRTAYFVKAARTLELVAQDNQFTFTEPDRDTVDELTDYPRFFAGRTGEATAFYFENVDESRALITRTTGSGATYGVTLHKTGDALDVDLRNNQFEAKEEEMHRV